MISRLSKEVLRTGNFREIIKIDKFVHWNWKYIGTRRVINNQKNPKQLKVSPNTYLKAKVEVEDPAKKRSKIHFKKNQT